MAMWCYVLRIAYFCQPEVPFYKLDLCLKQAVDINQRTILKPLIYVRRWQTLLQLNSFPKPKACNLVVDHYACRKIFRHVFVWKTTRPSSYQSTTEVLVIWKTFVQFFQTTISLLKTYFALHFRIYLCSFSSLLHA